MEDSQYGSGCVVEEYGGGSLLLPRHNGGLLIRSKNENPMFVFFPFIK